MTILGKLKAADAMCVGIVIGTFLGLFGAWFLK